MKKVRAEKSAAENVGKLAEERTMSHREFQFSEGSSNKFWAIEVNGKSQTVNYGRVGTNGQTQTKEFGSEAEAIKASDKLIAEKLKKGYREVTSGTKSVGTPTAKLKKAESDESPEKPKSEAAKVAEPEAVDSAASPNLPAIAAITRTIDLETVDVQKAEWPPKWRPQAKPEPRRFDLQQCVEALSAVEVDKYGRWNHLWPTTCISPGISPQELHFWFLALVEWERDSKRKPADVALKISAQKLSGKLTITEVIEILNGIETPGSGIVLPLFFLLSPDDIISLVSIDWKDKYGRNRYSDALVSGFARYVLPYLTETEVSRLQAKIRDKVQIDAWAKFQNVPPVCNLAAHLGMRDEVRAGLAKMEFVPPINAVKGYKSIGSFQQIRFWILSLGNPDWIVSEAQRFNVRWEQPAEIRHWLAVAQFSGLDIVRDSILSADSIYDNSTGEYKRYTAREQAERLAKEFARVKAPEAAPHMLELKLFSKATAIAQKWLQEEAGNAVAGLISIATGRGKLAEAAIDYLREAKKKGYEKLIRDCLKRGSSEVAESIKKNVLDIKEKEYAQLTLKAMPARLKAAFEAKAKKGKLPEWACTSSLPPIVIDENKLGDEEVFTVLEAVQRSTLDKVDPLITELKVHADAGSLDAFSWKLFQLWQSEGCPSKEKWAMGSIGHFGGDASALKLTPLIRNWPGESQHQRAVFGLECLRGIGTDTALMQLNGIAQKLKFKGLKQKAAEAMEAIATNKGLSRSQLEDRIVPDCELDERGSRVFDFGPRQFRFVLGPEMKPMLKDADNKVKPDLPKPGAKDDAAMAEAAVNDWKLLKKQIKEVTTIQAQRLEQAMITGRRWLVVDFETLLVKHPLMTNLVRLILWGGYDKGGKLTTTFRVTEDQTYANAKDLECKLQGLDEVGIVHPLHLTAEQQSAWGELFSDYEIVPPFRQLGRRIVRPEKDELKGDELTRFRGISVPAPVMIYGLEKLGWIRGTGMDGGCFDEHSKPFPASNVTAVAHYEGNVGFGYIDPNETVKIDTCYFVKGMRGPSGYAQKEQKVTLGDVDPVAVSEVLTDLSALAAKGK
jgi:predicted DNA-binding WGR domain protein